MGDIIWTTVIVLVLGYLISHAVLEEDMLRVCAEKHNVYKCELVAVPVTKGE